MHLLFAFIVSAGIMASFEMVKTAFFSGLTMWQSHIMTILFTASLSAVLVRHFVRQKQQLSDLDRSRNRIDAVSRVQSDFITYAGHQDAFSSLLDILVLSSGSEFGLIAELAHDAGGNLSLVTHAISALPGVDCPAAGSPLELYRLDTLTGDVITSGLPVVVNQPSRRASGLPAGYPAPHSFLCLPLHKGQSLIGVIAIANRKQGYDALLQAELTPLLVTCASLISAHRDHIARQQLEKRLNLTRTAIDKSKVPFFLVSPAGQLIDVNDYACLSLGYSREELLGKYLWDIDPDYAPESRSAAWERLREHGTISIESYHRRKDGSTFPVEITTSHVSLGDEEYGFSFALDITEKKLQEAMVWKQANYDALTGLPNRRLLQDRLEQDILKAQRSDSRLAVLFIDLDRFKEINDSLGHAHGDQLLMEAGRRIRECVRESDTVARFGGDEFAVVLPGFSDRLHLEHITQEIIEKLSAPFHFKTEQGYFISASIGITLYPDDANDMDGLLRHADQAMYKAKKEGRGKFCYFTRSMQEEARTKLALSQDLRQALQERTLQVHYQPIIDLASGRITKAEALLRWRHHQRGMISPALFIPLAEENGLAHEIDEWVFDQVTESIRLWQRLAGRTVQVGINKSPSQLERKPPGVGWHERLQSLGLPGESIKVEITEGSLLNDSPTMRLKLREYQDNGIQVSIDDFGTGFSSLSYLKKFDIDYLKIDRSFISNLTEDASDKALTEAIIVMAHKLGIKTIAEGVESVGQRDLLRAFCCDFAQGYFYSPAIPAQEFANLLMQEEMNRDEA